MSDAYRGREWPRRFWIVALIVLLASACGGSDSSVSDGALDVSVIAPANEVNESPERPQATTVPPTSARVSTVPVATPVQVLQQALAYMGVSYVFTSELTTSSGDRVVIEGHRVSDGSTHRIEVGGVALDVVTLAGTTWIREDGTDDWIESAQITTADPLAPLFDPISIIHDPTAPGSLLATYLGEAFGLDTQDPIDVVIGIEGDTITLTSANGSINLATTLTSAPTLAAILPPI